MPGNFSFLSKHCHHLNWYFSYLSFSFEIQVIKKSLSWNYKKFAFFNHHCLSCFQLVLIKTSSLNKCEQKKNNCVGRESNPDQLLGRQLCWPLYHRRPAVLGGANFAWHLECCQKWPPGYSVCLTLLTMRLVTPVFLDNKCWGYSSVVEQSAAVR